MRFLLDHDVPDDFSYLLVELGHDVVLLRKVLPNDSPDEEVLRFALDTCRFLLTCNRNDFLNLAANQAHSGLIIIIRRKSRGEERSALYRLLHQAGDAGILNNINFA